MCEVQGVQEGQTGGTEVAEVAGVGVDWEEEGEEQRWSDENEQ